MKPVKYGVWVNGALSFSNTDWEVANGYAQIKIRERNNVWLGKVGSFVAPQVSNA